SASFTVAHGTSTGTYGTSDSTTATSGLAVSGLTDGTAYYFMVTAVNANGSLKASSEGTITPVVAPSAPTSLAAVGGTSQVALSWTASTGSSPLYTVFRSTTSGSGYAAL